jgi:hypothetical protein
MEHYRDPEGHLRAYDVTAQVADARLHGAMLESRDELLATVEPILANAVFGPLTASDLVRFMEALTDDRARDLCDEVPAAVPSGLPVADPCLGG